MLQIVPHIGLHSHQQSQWGTSERHFETLEHSGTIVIQKRKYKIKGPETFYLKITIGWGAINIFTSTSNIDIPPSRYAGDIILLCTCIVRKFH